MYERSSTCKIPSELELELDIGIPLHFHTMLLPKREGFTMQAQRTKFLNAVVKAICCLIDMTRKQSLFLQHVTKHGLNELTLDFFIRHKQEEELRSSSRAGVNYESVGSRPRTKVHRTGGESAGTINNTEIIYKTCFKQSFAIIHP